MKKVKQLKINGHTAFFSESTDGGFVVRIPSIGGTATQGETLEEAEAMARDVVKGFGESGNDSQFVIIPKVKGFLKREVLRGIIKQAGMTPGEFIKLR